MEEQRNSECWYKDTCKEDCDRCIVYPQLKWQMDNSGLYPAQQHPIKLYITEHNRQDKKAFKELAAIREDIGSFVDNHENLYICSDNVGNGKTSWAIRMLHTYFHHYAVGNYENLLGMFVSTTDLLLKLKDFNNPLPAKYLQNLESVDLVVFDDIGVTGVSQYDLTQLYNIINKRLLANKSNIFTSNVTSYDKLEELLGSRLASRIYNSSEVIELKGTDLR